MNNTDCQEFIKEIEYAAQGIQAGKGLLNSDYIHDFEEKVRRAKEHAEEIINTDRDLKIGIVGQVKAGKSSFLNALIFNGEDVLPKAATPMTAALTRITYSEKPAAKVVFYNQSDWTVIESNSRIFDEELSKGIAEFKADKKRRAEEEKSNKGTAKFMPHRQEEYEPSPEEIKSIEDEIPELYRACKELTAMANNSSVNFKSKLGHEEEIPINDLKRDMEQYVGAKGKYAPIVKWVEMSISNKLLNGIEIVDTPGLGDPITSRSEKTKEFLMACDLVFILSPASQFLGSEDISLIMDTLPGDSINHAVIVGSKFDSAMLDDSARGKKPLIEVMKGTVSKLNASAKKVVADSLRAERGVHAKALQRINEEISDGKSLYYTSALLYNAAKSIKSGVKLGENENHILSQMETRFEGMQRSPEFLLELACIDRLRKIEFEKITSEKEKILEERSRGFIREQKLSFSEQINEIQAECEQNLRLIQTEDMSSLKKKREASHGAQAIMRRDIQNTFEACAVDAEKYMVSIAHDISARALYKTDINIHEEREYRPRSETTGWLWWKETKHWTDTLYHKAVNISDVIHNLHAYITDSQKRLDRETEKAIDFDRVRDKIKSIVLSAFEKSEVNFEPNDIIGPVELMLKKLYIPPFSIVDAVKYENIIVEAFPSSYVEDRNIADLELKQTQVLGEIARDISAEIEKKSKDVTQVLREQAAHFTDELSSKIDEKLGSLQLLLQEREKSVKLLREFLAKLAEYKERLR